MNYEPFKLTHQGKFILFTQENPAFLPLKYNKNWLIQPATTPTASLTRALDLSVTADFLKRLSY